MSPQTTQTQRSTIEVAMRRKSEEATPLHAPSTNAPSGLIPGRRDFDKELSQRFERIHAAQGNDALHRPHGRIAKRALPDATPPTASGKRFPSGALILATIVAILGGTGAALTLLADFSPIALAAPTPPATTPTPQQASVAPPPIQADNTDTLILHSVEQWRRAWTRRDVDAYLASYSPDFVPADGRTRPDWETARRKIITSQSDIDIQINEPRIQRIGADQAKIEFLQDYVSGRYRETARRKTLTLARSDGQWRITGEQQQ